MREATPSDAPTMAGLRRRGNWEGGGSQNRIQRYLTGEHHPQHAERDRIAYVGFLDGVLLGFIAGHRTKRFGCTGELQWILVDPDVRGTSLASDLFPRLREWFVTRGAYHVCINVALIMVLTACHTR